MQPSLVCPSVICYRWNASAAKADLNSLLAFSCPWAYSANGCSDGFEKHLPFMEDLESRLDLFQCNGDCWWISYNTNFELLKSWWQIIITDFPRFCLVNPADNSGQICGDFVAYSLVNLGAIQLVTTLLPNVGGKPTQHLPRISYQPNYWSTQLLTEWSQWKCSNGLCWSPTRKVKDRLECSICN